MGTRKLAHGEISDEDIPNVSYVPLYTDTDQASETDWTLHDYVMTVDAPLYRNDILALDDESVRIFLEVEDKELQAIEDREVVEGEVPIPKGVKPIDTRFVYKWKDPVSQPPDPVTGEIPSGREQLLRC